MRAGPDVHHAVPDAGCPRHNAGMQVLIIGASRGIGLELVRQYRANGATVTATARDDDGLARLRELGATALTLDVGTPAGAAALAWQIDGAAFDVVLHVAGVLGPRTTGLVTPTQAQFDEVMHVNVLGPMAVLPQLADALAPGRGWVWSRRAWVRWGCAAAPAAGCTVRRKRRRTRS